MFFVFIIQWEEIVNINCDKDKCQGIMRVWNKGVWFILGDQGSFLWVLIFGLEFEGQVEFNWK